MYIAWCWTVLYTLFAIGTLAFFLVFGAVIAKLTGELYHAERWLDVGVVLMPALLMVIGVPLLYLFLFRHRFDGFRIRIEREK